MSRKLRILSGKNVVKIKELKRGTLSGIIKELEQYISREKLEKDFYTN